jgi:hypothetical protein
MRTAQLLRAYAVSVIKANQSFAVGSVQRSESTTSICPSRSRRASRLGSGGSGTEIGYHTDITKSRQSEERLLRCKECGNDRQVWPAAVFGPRAIVSSCTRVALAPKCRELQCLGRFQCIGNYGDCVRLRTTGVRPIRLENRRALTGLVSSNVTLSAKRNNLGSIFEAQARHDTQVQQLRLVSGVIPRARDSTRAAGNAVRRA